MKNIFNLFVCLALATGLFAQNMDVDEIVIRRIADNIMDNTSLNFSSTDGRQTFNSTKDIPENVEARLTSTFGEWHYTNGVLNMAMINLSNFTGENKYFDYAANHVAFGMDNYKFFQKRFTGDRAHYYFPFGQIWTMKELDDCGAMGASMIDVYQKVKRPDYKEYIENTAKHITSGQQRLDDGTLVRTFPREMTIWGDDLYMSVPFLSRMGQFSGDKKYIDDAARQVFNFSKYLWDENKELYWHCYYSDLGRNGVAHWGRCNGWIMMAKVHLLNFMPADHPDRTAVIKDLERQILGISKYQDADGLWHQLLDKNDSYTESSCSAMFVYCIARAVNQGWIDKRYSSIALAGWEGLKANKITVEGQLKDVCVGTGIEEDLVFYYRRPARLNEKHGLGAVIDAGIEVIKLKETTKR